MTSDSEFSDQALDRAEFLKRLAKDIEAHPETLKPIDPALVCRVRALVNDVEIDLASPLCPEDEYPVADRNR